MAKITVEELGELLNYDTATGIFIWKMRAEHFFKSRRDQKIWNTRYAGKPAFCSIKPDGYRYGTIFNRSYDTHVIVWAMLNGEWPRGDIDHINGDTSDNRIENLRDVPHAINLRNQSRSKKNASGHTGVFFVEDRNKWMASIRAEGRSIFLGYHGSLESAVYARSQANLKYGYHPNHGRQKSLSALNSD